MSKFHEKDGNVFLKDIEENEIFPKFLDLFIELFSTNVHFLLSLELK